MRTIDIRTRADKPGKAPALQVLVRHHVVELIALLRNDPQVAPKITNGISRQHGTRPVVAAHPQGVVRARENAEGALAHIAHLVEFGARIRIGVDALKCKRGVAVRAIGAQHAASRVEVDLLIQRVANGDVHHQIGEPFRQRSVLRYIAGHLRALYRSHAHPHQIEIVDVVARHAIWQPICQAKRRLAVLQRP